MNKQFHSIIHDERFYKIRYPTSSHQQKKYPPYKLKNQQIFQKRQAIENSQKIAVQVPTNQYDLTSEVSKSQAFIHQHQARLSLSRLEKQKITLKKINKHFEKDQLKNNQDLIRKDHDQKCDSSLNFLMGAKTNAYKTQYSKITRRKQTIIKRPLIQQENQKGQSINSDYQPKNKHFQQISQMQLIEKYRQLMQQETAPFNLVNKLYQNDLLSTKLMPLLSKQKLIITKLNKNDKQIEERINKIVSKPTEYDTIRKMLLNIHDKVDQTTIYPYQTKQPKIQNETIQYRYNRHFDPILAIKKQQAIKSQELQKKMEIKNPIFKNQRNEETLSVPKIESESHINPNTAKQPYPPPKKIISSAYIIYEVNPPQKQQIFKKLSIQFSKKKQYQNNVHIGYNIKLASEIASLTKIMTCIIIIQICQKFKINSKLQKYKIGLFESFVHGTSADIQPGEIYTIHELLHGLMLPSGNDASLALARWGGNILLLTDLQSTKRGFFKVENSHKYQVYSWAQKNKFIRSEEQKLRAKRCYNRFIAEMNKKARILAMQRTTYVNSHGLSNLLNRSCCLDLALLCQHAMRNTYFRQIVSCKKFTSIIDKETVVVQQQKIAKKYSKCKNFNYDPQELNLQADAQDQQTQDKSEYGDDEQIQVKNIQRTKKYIQWANTHKLLHEKQQYLGIKTGVTATAGPCLASFIQFKQRKFIIIVLNSKKLVQRFIDTEILKTWLVKKQKMKIESKFFNQISQVSTQRYQQDNE